MSVFGQLTHVESFSIYRKPDPQNLINNNNNNYCKREGLSYLNRGWGCNRRRGWGWGWYIVLLLLICFIWRLRKLGNDLHHPAQHPEARQTDRQRPPVTVYLFDSLFVLSTFPSFLFMLFVCSYNEQRIDPVCLAESKVTVR